MTNEPDDDIRELLARHAGSVTPRGTYADLEAKLAADRAGRRVTGRHVVLALAAAIALVVGALTVALATGGDDHEVRTADGAPSTTRATTTQVTTTATDPGPTTSAVPTSSTTPATSTTTTLPATTTTTAPATTTTTTVPGPTPIGDASTIFLGGIDDLVLPAGIARAEQLTGRQVEGEVGGSVFACQEARFAGGPTDVTLGIVSDDPSYLGSAHDLGDRGRIVLLDVGPGGRVQALGQGARVGIGSTEAQVLAAFPGAEVRDRPSGLVGHELVVNHHEQPDVELLFRTDGAVVVQFSTGLRDYVETPKACG